MRPRSGPYRLIYGGQIDRTRRVSFRFDGKTYHGHPGDSLASALLANGVRVVARSFKLHRPRGIYSCGIEEPNALLQLGRGAYSVPSARAPMVDLLEGIEAHPQSGWPSVRFDVGRLLETCAPLWSAGFYNKTFIWPTWKTYEGAIRRMAGLGRAPEEPDPDRYETVNLHCDVLVVGGGAAGLCAALASARAGARVVLADQDHALGGRSAWDGSITAERLMQFPLEEKSTPPPSRVPAMTPANNWIGWVARVAAELTGMPEVTVLPRTTAVGCYDHNVVALVERVHPAGAMAPRERLHIVRAARVVLATGTIEQPLIFDHNDRPGIMLAGAARQYLCRYGVAVGSRVLLATNNDSVYPLAHEFKSAGVEVAALLDSRREQDIGEGLRVPMRSSGIPWFVRSLPIDTRGLNAVRAVTVGRLSIDARHIEARYTLTCDALAMSGGLAPALSLYAQAGGRLTYEADSGTLHPAMPRHPNVEIIGSACETVRAGPRISPVGRTRHQWVDLLHDVTVADLELALRENYTDIEHVKRYTTVGMAADQGKTATAATLDVLGRLRGTAPGDLGHTTLRPPVTPVSLGNIAGSETAALFAPKRLLPMHDWHVSHGGLMQDFGSWQRAVAYPHAGERREHAAFREALAVRTACGLFDGSSLGKIEIEGPDALEFLDRFYINNLKNLKPRRARYGLMLKESGVLFDDGTVVALASDHLLLTTTSGNAGRVYQWLEEWHQCEWPHLKLAITPVTEQWATVSLAGPRARAILSRLDSSIDLTNSAFPHLDMRAGKILGIPARIYRVSFTGELTYEINVPSNSGRNLWETLLTVGAKEGLMPIGLDALMQLRLEKGFLHVGTDTDGTTVPDDIGWGRVASAKQADFIGKRSLALREHVRPDRLQLVGLRVVGRTANPSPRGRERAFCSQNGEETSAAAGGASLTSSAAPGGPVRALGIAALHPPVGAARRAASSAATTVAGQAFIVGSHLRLDGSSNVTDGWITSAGFDTLTRQPIALAVLRAGRQHLSSEVTLYNAGKPVGRAEVVQPPFYDPSGESMNA